MLDRCLLKWPTVLPSSAAHQPYAFSSDSSNVSSSSHMPIHKKSSACTTTHFSLPGLASHTLHILAHFLRPDVSLKGVPGAAHRLDELPQLLLTLAQGILLRRLGVEPASACALPRHVLGMHLHDRRKKRPSKNLTQSSCRPKLLSHEAAPYLWCLGTPFMHPHPVHIHRNFSLGPPLLIFLSTYSYSSSPIRSNSFLQHPGPLPDKCAPKFLVKVRLSALLTLRFAHPGPHQHPKACQLGEDAWSRRLPLVR